MGVAAAGAAAGVHGFAPGVTSFVGRAGAVDEVAGLLDDCRLVTVTGPGGVGKTRLAGEVARRVAGRFADGVWLVELAAVTDPARVPSAVAAALGIRERPGVPVADSLAGVLAGWQVLLVLDSCEHVITAVAGLCGAVLLAADDVWILATSREPAGVAGEARYRLGPLGLPGPGQAGAGGSEAVALFADRARLTDPHFTVTGEAGPLVAQLVARLDGMPLAIELAAARLEALGLAQLLDRLDDRFRLLVAGDRLATARHRSLAAAVDWSYELLGEDEQRVFRWVSVFAAPFTLEGAEAVAGTTAGPVVLRLVDCSLLAPPRAGPDGRARYLMMDTLRAYGAGRLADAGEGPAAAAALARYALQTAWQCAAAMQASAGELAAARWLDAEDATVHQALAWALQHSPDTALRLAIALAPWWQMRGRMVAGSALLRAAAAHAAPGSDDWCAVHYWLGRAAHSTGDFAAGVADFTAICDAVADREPSPVLVDALAGRAYLLLATNCVGEGTEDAHRAVALASKIGHPAGEARAWQALCFRATMTGDLADAVTCARRAQRIDPAGLPGWIARYSNDHLMLALLNSGDVSAAWPRCTHGLVLAQQAGDLAGQTYCLGAMAYMDWLAGRIAEGWAHLRESTQIATRVGYPLAILNCEDLGGHLCAATRRWAEAVTLWAALDAHTQDGNFIDPPQDVDRRQAPLRKARQALGPARTRAAEQRGAAMTLATAAEFITILATPEPSAPARQGQLSARERELVTLVAQGRTDAQIASQLYISVRTVRSHLDRIRDKTGCRRRADLTRLALQTGLI
ncbi:MAG TPA: LuxR C-terminal-related transcriptional regulator [Streptosporangiaceae bacterium]|nr:LuxR C-terminal-related transcriptional regulator [Streptosporangiaceae bacterium]